LGIVRRLAVVGALLVAASIVSGCDPYRDVIIQNDSGESLVVSGDRILTV